MSTQSLGGETEFLAHGLHASLHYEATAGDFVAKLSETGGVAQGLQQRRLRSPPAATQSGINLSSGSVSIDLRASRLFSFSPRAA